MDLAERGAVIEDVLQHAVADHEVKALIRQREFREIFAKILALSRRRPASCSGGQAPRCVRSATAVIRIRVRHGESICRATRRDRFRSAPPARAHECRQRASPNCFAHGSSPPRIRNARHGRPLHSRALVVRHLASGRERRASARSTTPLRRSLRAMSVSTCRLEADSSSSARRRTSRFRTCTSRAGSWTSATYSLQNASTAPTESGSAASTGSTVSPSAGKRATMRRTCRNQTALDRGSASERPLAPSNRNDERAERNAGNKPRPQGHRAQVAPCPPRTHTSLSVCPIPSTAALRRWRR